MLYLNKSEMNDANLRMKLFINEDLFHALGKGKYTKILLKPQYEAKRY